MSETKKLRRVTLRRVIRWIMRGNRVHCTHCRWRGRAMSGPLKNCTVCGGYVVWTFTGRTRGKLAI